MSACRLGARCSIFMGLVAVATLLWAPFALAAEPTQDVVRLGFVGPGAPSTAPRGIDAFWERLRELGWVKGQNLVVEERWAEGRLDRLPGLMAEVVGRKVDVLVTYGQPAGIAAKNATRDVPLVDAVMGDPLLTGLVPSLARPGGNLTGLSFGWGQGIGGKQLELLQEVVPRLAAVAVFMNPDNPLNRAMKTDLEAVAPLRHVKLRIIAVRDPGRLDRAFEQARRQAQALVVLADPVTTGEQRRVTALATRHRLPAMYALRDFVDVGGLMAYGPDFAVMFRRAADYVDKILRGAKPADLPIEQPTHYVLVVNLKTAKALGITMPESILLRADEVIRW